MYAESLSALNAAGTVAPIPADAAGFPAEYRPDPGSVHRLGSESAFAYAWRTGDRVCWTAREGGGCLSTVQSPFDWVIHDPDSPEQGVSTTVSGLVIDGVMAIEVLLTDGTSVSVLPDANYYRATLPSRARPWDVSGITATLSDGTQTSTDIRLSPPKGWK
jgi:hypothetical protein